MARSSEYTPEIAAEICSRLAQGNSLRTICEADDMPAASTVFLWLGQQKDFSEQYARAREQQAEALAEEILEIADDAHNDWMERKHGDSVSWVENGEAIQRSKLRVDSRKWLMSKMAPKKYGDKITQENTGPDGGAIKHVHKIEWLVVDPKTGDSAGIPPATPTETV
jgi:hypothetical protein